MSIDDKSKEALKRHTALSGGTDPADVFDIEPEEKHTHGLGERCHVPGCTHMRAVPKEVSDRSDTSETLTIEPDEFDPTAPAPGEDAVKQDGMGRPVIRLPSVEPGAPRVIPEWAKGKIPKGLVFPRGIFAYFVRIKAHLTHARHKGDRILILWETTEGDEKLAYGRSMQDPSRAVAELAKQMIRAFDGHLADHTGVGPGNVDQLWRELGPKGRNMVTILHAKICVMQQEDLIDFFENSIGAVSTG